MFWPGIHKVDFSIWTGSARLCKGVFTSVNNKNSAEKSVLDHVIVSSNLSDNIVFMTIDDSKLLPLGVTFKGAKDLLIVRQLYLYCSVNGLKVMTGSTGKWFGILMMIWDEKVT